MIELILAITVFFISHLIPAIQPLRNGLIRVLGERGYLIFFSVLSIAVIIWLGLAFSTAPYIEIWQNHNWHYQIPLYVMPIACVFIIGGMTSKNPFSLGPSSIGYDPDQTGYVGITRHPVIWGLILWSLVHIFPNGDVASVLMFGFFFILCLVGIKTIERRRRSRMGETTWNTQSQGTSIIPFQTVLKGTARIKWGTIVGWRLIAGVIFYLVLLYLHETIIGAAPVVLN